MRRVNFNRFIKRSIYFVCIYMMLINFICDFFKLPTIIRYIPDLFLPFYILYLISKINVLMKKKSTRYLLFIVILFLIHCIVGSVINFNSIFYFIWGFRNLFRFFCVSLCAILVFDDSDKDNLMKIIHQLFVFNAIICFSQYFILGYWGDAIGGIFRLGDSGGNSGVIYLLIIENINNIINYLNKKCFFKKVSFFMLITILIAIIAELKIIYIFIILIVLLSLLLNKFSLRTVMIVLSIICVLILGFSTLKMIDPETAEILNIEKLMDYAGGEDHGYSTEYDISRTRAFSQINEYFFSNSIRLKIWGYGLGHCDVSSAFRFFNSKFAELYNDLLHYTWFSHAMLYLETGIVGYILYLSFFTYIIIYCLKKRKLDKINYNFYNFIIILGILSIIMTFYNSVLRNDISYFVYVVLVFPFVVKVKENKNERIN